MQPDIYFCIELKFCKKKKVAFDRRATISTNSQSLKKIMVKISGRLEYRVYYVTSG